MTHSPATGMAEGPSITEPAPAAQTRMARMAGRARAFATAALAHPALRWLSPLLGLAMLAALGVQAADIGWDTIARLWPSNPWFYVIFLAAYFAPVLSELFIYRRLWGVQASDAPMFFRKRVLNEAFLSYSGEAYAVFWARKRGLPGVAAAHVVKDVNMTSAAVGLLATLLLIGATFFLSEGERLASAAIATSGPALAVALGIMGVSLAVLLLKPRLFSLPRAELANISAVHAARVLFGVASTIWMWDIALAGVPWALWLTLAAWRTFFQRLPVVPNKDLLFVNLAILALGAGGRDIAAILAVTAALTILAHLLTLIVCAFLRSPSRPLAV